MNTLLVMKSLALATTFASCGVAGFAIAAPLPPYDPSGVRGLMRQRALASGGLWVHVEPVVRWLGLRVRHFLSPTFAARIDRKLRLAGDILGLLPEELVALGVLGATAAGAPALCCSPSPATVVVAAALGAALPFSAVASATKERQKSVSRGLPGAIDLLSLAMGAGLDFPGALRQAVEKSGTKDDPLIEELSFMLLTIGLGRTRREALEQFAERVPIPPVVEFVGAMVQAELRGNPVVEVLAVQAGVARLRRIGLGEEAASNASVALVLPLALMLIATIVLIGAPIFLRMKETGF